jgi:hypothetical protein
MRVFPMPGSPASITIRPAPVTVSSIAALRPAISRSRPTNIRPVCPDWVKPYLSSSIGGILHLIRESIQREIKYGRLD